METNRYEIWGTPFVIMGIEQTGYWITIGRHRVSDTYKTRKECEQKLIEKDWNIILPTIIALIHDRQRIDESYKKEELSKNNVNSGL